MVEGKECSSGFAVRAHSGGFNIEHEQEFYFADFDDAHERAEKHAAKIRILFPGCEVNVFSVWGINGGESAAC